jgi:formate-nitrite transporter family protein
MDSSEQKQKATEEAEERRSPSSHDVHETILSEGREELARPGSALAWSGFSAGLSMGASLIAEALIADSLPAQPWAILVSKFGYSVGFLLVILGRQQLFTENTLTPIIPLLEHKDRRTFLGTARLWAIVFATNFLGAVAIAIALIKAPVFTTSVRETFLSLGHESLAPGFVAILWRGVFAGWLIALLVWLMPFAETARVWVIIIVTYVVGIGHFSHVVAGSVEVFALAAAGELGWLEALAQFTLPAFIGNVLGGVALVAFLNHAQAKSGLDE